MSTLTVARRLMAACAPLTGSRGTGTMRAVATGADVVVNKGCVIAPLTNGQIDFQRLVWVTADTTVTSAGTSVPVASLVGGSEQNLPVGSGRFHPTIDGVEPVVTNASSLSGGTTGLVKQVTYYETISASVASDLFKGKVSRFPAVVVAYQGSGPYESLNRGTAIAKDTWRLYVVVSRVDGSEQRGAEGLGILDEIEALLTERQLVDGLVLSYFPTFLRARGRTAVAQSSFVYWADVNATRLVTRTVTTTSETWDVSVGEVRSDGHPVVVDNQTNMRIP